MNAINPNWTTQAETNKKPQIGKMEANTDQANIWICKPLNTANPVIAPKAPEVDNKELVAKLAPKYSVGQDVLKKFDDSIKSSEILKNPEIKRPEVIDDNSKDKNLFQKLAELFSGKPKQSCNDDNTNDSDEKYIACLKGSNATKYSQDIDTSETSPTTTSKDEADFESRIQELKDAQFEKNMATLKTKQKQAAREGTIGIPDSAPVANKNKSKRKQISQTEVPRKAKSPKTKKPKYHEFKTTGKQGDLQEYLLPGIPKGAKYQPLKQTKPLPSADLQAQLLPGLPQGIKLDLDKAEKTSPWDNPYLKR